MRREFNEIRNKVSNCSNLQKDSLDTVLNIVDDVESNYLDRSTNSTILSSTVNDLEYCKKRLASPLTMNSIDVAIKLLRNIEDIGWCPIEPECSLPDEGVEVEVTIMEDYPDNPFMKVVSVTTSWVQDGEWVIRKSSLNPKVVAWKYHSSPYVPETLIISKPLRKSRGE